MLGSVYRKLALALLAILAIIGGLYLGITLLTTRLFLQEVNQKLDRDVAAHLVSDVLLMENGEVRKEGLEDAFHMMMVVNPSIEIYLLDRNGKILAYSAPPGKVGIGEVPLDPVKRFLDGAGKLPVTGVDPRNPGSRKAFSAAPIIEDGTLRGYLYVVLGGEQYDSAVQLLQGSYVLRLGAAAVVAGLLFTFAAGLLLFRVLTRRLRRLSADMDEFQRKVAPVSRGPGAPPPAAGRQGDEIDHLRYAFEGMANRIAEQLDELERGDRLRRELVANVSHDLRTPLASLRGYLETLLLKEGELTPEEEHRYLESSLRHAERLGLLVSELFELAKLEAAETRPEPEPFALAELVQDVVQKHALAAEGRGIRLRSRFDRELPFVVADIGLVARVLENLLANALRFTPESGDVTVSLVDKEGAIGVEVADTGCGIPAEDLPHVFDRFYQSRSGGDKAGEGSGLGLAISRKIVELHGGRLEVDSVVGRGSTFRFDLPVNVP